MSQSHIKNAKHNTGNKPVNGWSGQYRCVQGCVDRERALAEMIREGFKEKGGVEPPFEGKERSRWEQEEAEECYQEAGK